MWLSSALCVGLCNTLLMRVIKAHLLLLLMWRVRLVGLQKQQVAICVTPKVEFLWVVDS